MSRMARKYRFININNNFPHIYIYICVLCNVFHDTYGNMYNNLNLTLTKVKY